MANTATISICYSCYISMTKQVEPRQGKPLQLLVLLTEVKCLSHLLRVLRYLALTYLLDHLAGPISIFFTIR